MSKSHKGLGRLEGKVAIITGAASGIGDCTARIFAAEGAAVVIGDIQTAMGEAVANDIRQTGRQADFIELDVSSDAMVRNIVRHTMERFGRIDILINNAGMENSKPDIDTSEEEWDRVLDVNAKGTFLCTKHTVPHMIASGGGSIVNISSVYGIIGSPGFAAYHASKGAIRTYTKAAAVAHAPHNIRVNSIHPGLIETPQMRTMLNKQPDPAEAEARFTAYAPVKRFAGPEAIAYGCLYLSSHEAEHVTGAELVIDGGMTAW